MARSARFLKGQITKAANRSEEQLRGYDTYRLNEFLEDLNSDFSELKDHFSGLQFNEQNEQELLDEFTSYEEKYHASKALLRQEIDLKLDRRPNETADFGKTSDRTIQELFERQGDFFEKCSTRLTSKKSDVNMPKIKIPIFSGKYEEWAPFKNLFESVVGKNRDLSDVEKLYYLRSSVKDEAAGIIHHFKLIGENFRAAWGALVSRYDKPFMIICSVIDNVLHSEKVKEGRVNLRQTCALLNESVRILDSLGEYAQSRDPWVIKTFMSKLDAETIDHWARANANDNEPDLEDFLSFLNAECDTLELKNPFATKNEKRTVRSMSAFVGRCFVCSGDHKIFDCKTFLGMRVPDREKLVKDKHRCVNCLGSGHYIKLCTSKLTCMHCHRRHHSLLHRTSSPTSSAKPAFNPSGPLVNSDPSNPLIKINASVGPKSIAILPTALVKVYNGNGGFMIFRALLDSGSQASFISEGCFVKLNMRRLGTRIPVSAFSSSTTFYSKGAVNATIASVRDDSKNYVTKLHILSKFISDLPDNVSSFKNASLIKSSFDLADPEFDIPSGVDLILGADMFFNILESSKYYCPSDNLWIIESSLGWLVSGGSDHSNMDEVKLNSLTVTETDRDLDEVLRKFWELEEPDHVADGDSSDVECERLFCSSIARRSDGRYSVGLPFKCRDLQLGESYDFALKRYLHLEKKFDRDRDLHLNYTSLMLEFISKGYIEKVPDNELDLPVEQRYYLPHYGVFRNSDDCNKLRIVFDASMKCNNGVSLNDLLHTGPNLQRDIYDIVNEFRFPRYVFMADIIKMYRQIEVKTSDRNYQRIFWRDEKSCRLGQWRLTTVTDGESASPYLALRVLKQLSIDEKERHPLGSKCLSQNYMDDFIVGDDCLKKLIEKRIDLEAVLLSAGMQLSKFASNDHRVLDTVPADRRLGSGLIEVNGTGLVKTLGLCWNSKDDCFTFRFDGFARSNLTKRSFLSLVARVYDPMGWLSPITIKLKAMFQLTWTLKMGWDDRLTPDMEAEWNIIANQLSDCANVVIPRHLSLSRIVEIHGYCDASTTAYAAVIYVRSVSKDSAPIVRLLTSKTKVAPIKNISIARMELCGAHLLARLMTRVIPLFSEYDYNVFCWSDSTTVLAWLAGNPKRWVTFIANRCSQIREWLPGVNWYYVKSKNNPADVASRGMNPKDLLCFRMWWCGPEDLHGVNLLIEQESFLTDLEERKVVVNVAMTNDWINDVVDRFSSFDRLRRVFARILCWKNIAVKRSVQESVEVSPADLDESVRLIMRLIQESAFRMMIHCLRNGKPISSSDPHFSLAPFLDNSGLVRVGGRLANAPCAYDRKFPIILPRDRFVELLIDYVHLKYFHSGVKLTLSVISSQIYVVRLKAFVKKRISACVTCKRFKAETFQPAMGPVPAYRFGSGKPFSETGIDFAGPFSVRPFRSRGKMTTKSYVAVMVCMATRAVHLEMVFGLDVDSLIMCLRRFIARRGRCRTLYSDNGRNFLGCSRLMREYNRSIVKNVDDPAMKSYLLENLVSWQFIPPYSPHFGGIWESVVRSFKFHLIRSVGEQVLIIEEFTTVLAQIEAILNSRPLVSVNDESDDLRILTPAHLLTGSASIELPLVSDCVSLVPFDDRKRFKCLNNIVRSFWGKWRNEYYTHLYRKAKWVKKGREPELGELVLLKRKFDPPTLWRRARVVKVYKGSDGIVRVVDLKTASGIQRESVRNLVPLDLKSETSTGEIMMG